MRYLTLVFALLLSSLSALAADVAGTWALTIESPNGPLDVTLTLKQDGDKLTGIVSSQMGEAPITGTVKDSAVEFTMNFDANGTVQGKWQETSTRGRLTRTARLPAPSISAARAR